MSSGLSHVVAKDSESGHAKTKAALVRELGHPDLLRCRNLSQCTMRFCSQLPVPAPQTITGRAESLPRESSRSWKRRPASGGGEGVIAQAA